MNSRFWELVCAAMPVWGILFGVSIIFLVFTLLSLYLTTPDASTFPIMVINAVLSVVLLSAVTVTIRKCRSGDF